MRKAEETKRQTIEKLVKVVAHTSPKGGKKHSTSTEMKRQHSVPMIKYTNKIESISLSYPKGFDYPLKVSKSTVAPPRKRTCVVCGNARKYDCSKTKRGLCSLKCYRINLNLKSQGSNIWFSLYTVDNIYLCTIQSFFIQCHQLFIASFIIFFIAPGIVSDLYRPLW